MTAKQCKYLQAAGYLMLMGLLFLGLQSCSVAVKPDLERLYRQNQEVKQPPVVLIHGLMGSKLEEAASGQEIWVGSPVKLLFSDYAETALEIDPQTLLPKPSSLVASGLLDHVAGKNYYAGITETLESAGRFQYAEPGTRQSAGSRNYYVFAYDWRQGGSDGNSGNNAKCLPVIPACIERLDRDLCRQATQP